MSPIFTDLYDDEEQNNKFAEDYKTAKEDSDKLKKHKEEVKKYRFKLERFRNHGIKVGYSVANVLEKHFDYDCNTGFTLQSNLCLVTFCFSMLRIQMRY